MIAGMKATIVTHLDPSFWRFLPFTISGYLSPPSQYPFPASADAEPPHLGVLGMPFDGEGLRAEGCRG